MIDIKKYWHDPVWSKVISAGIIALFSLIPISVFWQVLKPIITVIITFISKNWSYGLNIILILLLCSRLFTTIRNTKGLKWFKSLGINGIGNYMFLLWFPLHQQLTGSFSKLTIEDSIKINNSKRVADLLEHKIITMKYINTMTIDKKVYNYLEKIVKDLESNSDTKDLIKKMGLK